MPPSPETAPAGRGATHSARLLMSCPDGPGIVSAIGTFLFEQGANIVTSAQYSTHPAHGAFFMRIAFYRDGLDDDRTAFEAPFGTLAALPQVGHRVQTTTKPRLP